MHGDYFLIFIDLTFQYVSLIAYYQAYKLYLIFISYLSIKDSSLENQFSGSFAYHFSLFSAGHFGSLCKSH